MKAPAKVLLLFLCTLLLFSGISLPTAATDLSAASAILLEATTGKVIYAKDPDKRRPMASTTKIVTAIVALEALALDEEIAVPKEAVGIEGSSTYLEAGEILTFEQLLYALLLQSANDAAVTIAMAADGSVEGFVARMNAFVARLGLSNTHFANPHGLPDEQHYTTARELATIAEVAMQNAVFRKIVSTKKHAFTSSMRSRVLTNHNKLLRLYPSAVGIKTGFTRSSGRCLVGAAEENGLLLISVTLDAPNDWNDHKQLFDLGYSLYEKRLLLRKGEVAWQVPVIGGTVPFCIAQNREAFSAVMPKQAQGVHIDLDIATAPVAPVTKGQTLGYILLLQNGREIGRLPLCAVQDIPRLPIKKKGRIYTFFKKLLNKDE